MAIAFAVVVDVKINGQFNGIVPPFIVLGILGLTWIEFLMKRRESSKYEQGFYKIDPVYGVVRIPSQGKH